jgi:DNA-binding SARP family transcriptional activator
MVKMMPPWRIELFGGLRAARGDETLRQFPTRKAASLLAFLAYHAPRTYPREVLIEMLWPESDLEAGRSSLNVALSSLRQQLEAPDLAAGTVIASDRFAVGLNPEGMSTDVAEFRSLLQAAADAGDDQQRADLLARAAALYQGELLPGFYEGWIPVEQERLAEALLQALSGLISLAERRGDLPGALEFARRAVSQDPLREEGYLELIRLYAAAGRPAAARRQYQQWRSPVESPQRLSAQIPPPRRLRVIDRADATTSPNR